MILLHLRTAIRSLKSNRLVTGISIIGLAIGVAASLLILIWVKNELTYDRATAGSQYIFQVVDIAEPAEGARQRWRTIPYDLGEIIANQVPGVEALTRVHAMGNKELMMVNSKPFYEDHAVFIDNNWLPVSEESLSSGNIDDFLDHPFSILITEKRAEEIFGTGDVIGRIIKYDSSDYLVRGVVKNNPVNSSFQFSLFFNLRSQLQNARNSKTPVRLPQAVTFVRLRQDADLSAVTNGISEILTRFYSDLPSRKSRAELLPLNQLHFDDAVGENELIRGNKTMVYLFLALAILLLISASAGFVNLTTARATTRSKEVGIRKIIGAGKSNLFWQFIVESTFTSVLASAVAVILVVIAMPHFNELIGMNFPSPLREPGFWMMAGVVVLMLSMMNSIYPAVLLSSLVPKESLQGKGPAGKSGGSIRKTLVVLQFSLSIFLIIATIGISRQTSYVLNTDTGVDKNGVFQVMLPYAESAKLTPEKRESLVQSIKTKLKQIAHVQHVSLAMGGMVDVGVFYTDQIDWPGKDAAFNPEVSPFEADRDFHDLFRLKISRGRWFEDVPGEEKTVVVNETAVRVFGLKEPVIGGQLINFGDTCRIIGVVQDFHYKSLHEKIGPQVFMHSSPETGNFYIKPGPGATRAAIKSAEKVWSQFFPGYPFSYVFVSDDYKRLYKNEIIMQNLLFVFSAVTIAIACLSLFGLGSFSVQQRTKEISIRKVLGASVSQIISLLSVDFMVPVLIASLIACPLAYYALNKWLDNFAYKLVLAPFIFVVAIVMAMVLALATIGIQAAKAAYRNPVETMRHN